MGTDKGLLKAGDETWAELAARKFKALDLPVLISVNAQQYPVYTQVFSAEELVVDNDEFTAKAPLFGLLSVHLQVPGKNLFVLACDIKNITTALMQHLVDTFYQSAAGVCVYRTGSLPQPLCGIYTAAGLKEINGLYQAGNLNRYSMMHVLDLLATYYIPVDEESFPAFANYNSPEDG